MNFSEEEQNKLQRLPFVLRSAVNYLAAAINNILNDDCNEETVISAMATVNSNASGRYSNEDLVNYEQAAKILGVSETNRARTKLLLDANGVKQVVMHNHKVGFVRTEVVALADRLDSNNKQKCKK